MRHPYNSSQRAAIAFPPTRSLCVMALLFGLLAMLPMSAFAQSPAQDDDNLLPDISAAAFVLSGSAAGGADGIESVGNAQLAQLSGMYVPAGSANVIRRDAGVILWDEGSGAGTRTRVRSSGSGNQQSNSLTVVSR